MADLDRAKRKIDRVIFKMWRKDAVMFGALSLLDKIPDPAFETMGIDVVSSRKVSLRYNPNFVNTISIERLELVLVIEGFRVLLRHCTTRLKEPGHISQLCSSLAINQLMNDDLNMLLNGIDEFMPAPERFGLPPKQAFEEYFRGLMEKAEKTNETISQIWKSMSKEEKEKALQNAMDKYEQEMDEKEQNADEDNYQQFEDEKDAMKEHTNPNGNANSRWGKNNAFDADMKALVKKVKNKRKFWGKYTKDAQEEILAAVESKVSCKDVIRKFNCSVLTGKSVTSRMKISRRWDIERPGYRRIYKPHVIFAIDVSGSMTNEDLAYGFAVVNRLLFMSKITFVEFDTEIKNVEKNFTKAKKTFKVHGRGGTDFEQIMTMADNEKSDGVIIYTDGYAPAPHKPKCRTLWLMTAKNLKPPVDWGFRTFLDRFEDSRVW